MIELRSYAIVLVVLPILLSTFLDTPIESKRLTATRTINNQMVGNLQTMCRVTHLVIYSTN